MTNSTTTTIVPLPSHDIAEAIIDGFNDEDCGFTISYVDKSDPHWAAHCSAIKIVTTDCKTCLEKQANVPHWFDTNIVIRSGTGCKGSHTNQLEIKINTHNHSTKCGDFRNGETTDVKVELKTCGPVGYEYTYLAVSEYLIADHDPARRVTISAPDNITALSIGAWFIDYDPALYVDGVLKGHLLTNLKEWYND